MLKYWIGIFAILGLTACAPLAPSPGDQAVRIEGKPGMAVIYIVRPRPDLSYLTTQVLVDERMVGATYAGTHIRVEVAPGRHRITGYGHDNGALTIDVASDRVYFVHHTVSGSWRVTNPHSFFRLMDEATGRAAMARAPIAG